MVPTAKTQQRRLASLSRWYKAHKAAGAIVAAEPPSLDTVSLPPGMSEGTRLARRGEFEHLGGSYHNYTAQGGACNVSMAKPGALGTGVMAGCTHKTLLRMNLRGGRTYPEGRGGLECHL